MNMAIAVERFNSNVSYSGLLHAVTGDVSVLTSLQETLGLFALKDIDMGKCHRPKNLYII